MARLPDIQSARPVARPSRAIASISPNAAAATGQAVQEIGQEVEAFGKVMFDRETTAEATERDTMLSNQIRDLIYNPETGFAGMKGNQAVQSRQSTIEKLEALKENAYKGLNADARRKLESSLTRRITGAMDTVERHTLGERDNWLAGASAARVEAAYQDSLSNPADTAASLTVIENETRARGVREGWGSERTQVELEANRSKLFADQVTRIAASDPIAAMQYMRDNEDRMVASDIVNLEGRLTPEVKKSVGRMTARKLLGGAELSMNTRDVNRPGNGITNISLDFNASSTGGARGTEVIVPDDASPEMRQAAEDFNERMVAFAAKHGIVHPNRGVKTRSENGRGVNNTMHVEPFFNDNTQLQNAIMGDFDEFSKIYEEAFGHLEGARIIPPHGVGADRGAESEIFGNETAFGQRVVKALIDGKEGALSNVMKVRQLMDIPDDVEREAAIREANLMLSLDESEQKAMRSYAQDKAFELINGGGSLSDLTVEHQNALGQSAMSSLYSYQATVASGDVVQTDPVRYYELRQMQVQDPKGFRSWDMTKEINNLDQGDWQKMVDAQTKPSSDITTSAASTLMTMASRQLVAAGFDTTPEEGSDDANAIASLQSRLLHWQDDFAARENRAPTKPEIDERVGRELMSVLIDRPWRADSEAAMIEQMGKEFSAEDLEASEITIGGTTIPNDQVRTAISILRNNGTEITPETLLDFLAESLTELGF